MMSHNTNTTNADKGSLSPGRASGPRKRMLKSTSLQPKHSNNSNNNDMELAAEIGQGLLSEVRKMQSLLHQNQDSLMALELEKVEQEHQMDTLAKQLKQKAQREEKLNEEIWNLELAKQELMQQVQDMSQDLAKALAEQHRLARQESLSSAELDQLRSAQLAWNEKSKEHDQQVATLRRTLTQLRREIRVLQQQKHHHKRGPVHGERVDKNDNESGQPPVPQQQPKAPSFSGASAAAMASSPSKKKKDGQHAKTLEKLQLEIGTLQNSLKHAHEIVAVLERDLNRERVKRAEVDTLLYEAQETIEGLQQQQDASPVEDESDGKEKEKEQQHKEEEEEEAIQHVRRLQPQQREMSLGDELVNAGTMWDFVAFEPITNHSIPLESSPSTIPSQNFAGSSSSSSRGGGNSYENYGTFVVQSNTYVYNTSHDGDPPQKRDQALISPARASAFDFDPAFINNNNKKEQEPMPASGSDSRATLTTNLVPAVTRTMIGDWMYKYTRKVVGSGISENKHKRFFWIHPYTRTMYWSSREPGMDTHHAHGNKSALILSFQAIPDGGGRGDDTLSPPSIMVQTPARSLKIRCLDIMAHRAWMKALHYLVSDNATGASSNSNSHMEESPFTSIEKTAMLEASGSLSMLFQPRSRSSLSMPPLPPPPPASKSLASMHAAPPSSFNNFSRPFFEFSFKK
ncbi:meiotic cell cortex C-terminal pleckstrin homology-domain-containing protein [Zychaea mexicana]|uniref:uncharacterized protein n=1 Tax=Zychaea mexicana TaxID=64656 RepID=UPI0022FDF42B|nr:uncharacterized protein BDB00DRAFT_487214 [Zychaea mexicana]KAI9491533.1 meiotic cell cortex C-terminal pleckstrin homology-domain-containing protein [Zychaea mexicana]